MAFYNKKDVKIGHVFSKKNKAETKEMSRARIINENTRFNVKEAYKALRTNIIFTLPKKSCKKIIVTSAYAAEGKSTNCLNLAITFAENNSKVLLVDCDLRRPSIGTLLEAGRHKEGLSDLLVGLANIEDVITKTKYKNLDVIFSGSISPNPSELVGSENMENIIEALSEKYDYIILDTPPINIVTDTVILSRLCDGVVLVVRQGITEMDSVKEAVEKLKIANAKILGFVLNGKQCKTYATYSRYHKNYNYKKYYKYD